MNGDTDRYYVERCLDGHREDFRHLVVRYQKPLVAGIRLRQARADGAEDVAQEAFVRAYFNLAKLRKPDSFFPWLFGIACRILLERAEHERRERQGLARVADAEACRRDSGPWRGDAALERALAALSDPFRDVVLLRFYGDFSCGEIAERLRIPLGTVTKRLSRAYDELRHSLAALEPR